MKVYASVDFENGPDLVVLHFPIVQFVAEGDVGDVAVAVHIPVAELLVTPAVEPSVFRTVQQGTHSSHLRTFRALPPGPVK